MTRNDADSGSSSSTYYCCTAVVECFVGGAQGPGLACWSRKSNDGLTALGDTAVVTYTRYHTGTYYDDFDGTIYSVRVL